MFYDAKKPVHAIFPYYNSYHYEQLHIWFFVIRRRNSQYNLFNSQYILKSYLLEYLYMRVAVYRSDLPINDNIILDT